MAMSPLRTQPSIVSLGAQLQSLPGALAAELLTRDISRADETRVGMLAPGNGEKMKAVVFDFDRRCQICLEIGKRRRVIRGQPTTQSEFEPTRATRRKSEGHTRQREESNQNPEAQRVSEPNRSEGGE